MHSPEVKVASQVHAADAARILLALPGARRESAAQQHALYVLTHGAAVVYAGRTANVRERLLRHTFGAARPVRGAESAAWTEAIVIEGVPPHLIRLRERALIAWLRPACNAPVVLDKRLRGVLENWIKL